MPFLPRLALGLLGLLVAACAVNPLTPTPLPASTDLVVALRLSTGAAPIEAQPTEARASPTRVSTDGPTEAPTATAGALVIATEVSIVELSVPATQPPLPPPTVAPALPTAVLPAPTTGPPPPTAVPPVVVAPPPAADVAAAEQYCIELINAQRAAVGLPPYARDETVMGIARARVADMVARGYRGHYDPVTGAALAQELLRAAGFRWASENWYGHRSGPVAIVDAGMAWFMTDPPHAQGILNSNYTLVGVGIAYNGQQWLLVQNFAGY